MRISKIILLTISILAFFASVTFGISEKDIKTVDITISNNGSYVFAIRWENNDADLELITPDGMNINRENIKDYGTYKKSSQEYKAQYIISNASAGNWKLLIAKESGVEIGNVSIEVVEIESFLTVQDFNVIQDEEEKLVFNWKVINTESDSVHVIIGYDYDTIGYDGVEIFDGYYDLEKNLEINPYNIHPDLYYFYIRVEDDQGIIAYKYSDAIEVSNSKAPNPVEIESVTTQDNNVTVRWKPSSDSIDGYKIYYYINDGQGYNLLEEVEVSEDLYEYSTELPFKDSNYKVGVVAYNYRGLESRMSEWEFNFQKTLSIKLDVQWIEGDVINMKNIIIPFTIDDGYKVTSLHNDEVILDNISESGALRISLDEGMNHITFRVEDSEGNTRTEERGYYLDSIPPQLRLDDDYSSDDIIDSTITISGRVELGSELFINNQIIEYNKENGKFEYVLEVTNEVKALAVKARDEAGNITQYFTEIEFSQNNSVLVYLPHIILGLTTFVILLTYYFKKRKDI